MAGHSKWAQIKRQKGVTDKKRGALFSKLSAAITIAARGGSDPETNFQLRLAIDKAKQANMPKDNIERAIDRATGAGGVAIEEIMFEAYGPGGSAFLIETATDNRNRSVGEIRATLNKYNGKLAESGSVSYLFNKLGQLIITEKNLDEAELAAIEAGAQEIERLGSELFVYTAPTELEQVRRELDKANIESNEVSFEWQAINPIKLEDRDTAKKIITLLENLEDLADVNRVFGNFEIDETLLD